jgi:hypothetical protein
VSDSLDRRSPSEPLCGTSLFYFILFRTLYSTHDPQTQHTDAQILSAAPNTQHTTISYPPSILYHKHQALMYHVEPDAKRQLVSQISNLEPANVKVSNEYIVMLRTLHQMYLFLLAVSLLESKSLNLAFNNPVTIHGVNCSLMCPYVAQRTPARRMKRNE